MTLYISNELLIIVDDKPRDGGEHLEMRILEFCARCLIFLSTEVVGWFVANSSNSFISLLHFFFSAFFLNIYLSIVATLQRLHNDASVSRKDFFLMRLYQTMVSNFETLASGSLFLLSYKQTQLN